MTTSLQSTHLECLKSATLPKAAFLGQLEEPWKENLYFATWHRFPNLVEILEENIQINIIPWFFFSSSWCFFSTRSQEPWKLREWQTAIGKTWVSRKSAEMLFNWQGKKRRNENRNKISSVFGPRALPGICQFTHPEIWRDSRWKHFHFFFLLSLYFIGSLGVTIWKFPSIGLRKKLRQLFKIYRGKWEMFSIYSLSSLEYMSQWSQDLHFQNGSIFLKKKRWRHVWFFFFCTHFFSPWDWVQPKNIFLIHLGPHYDQS